MNTVTFEFDVDVPGEWFDEEDPSDEIVIEKAREILATAPAFDGLDDTFIADLEVSSVSYEPDN